MEQSNQPIGKNQEDAIILSNKLFVEIAKRRILSSQSLPQVIPINNNQTDIRYNSPPKNLIIKKRQTPPPLPPKRKRSRNNFYDD